MALAAFLMEGGAEEVFSPKRNDCSFLRRRCAARVTQKAARSWWLALLFSLLILLVLSLFLLLPWEENRRREITCVPLPVRFLLLELRTRKYSFLPNQPQRPKEKGRNETTRRAKRYKIAATTSWQTREKKKWPDCVSQRCKRIKY